MAVALTPLAKATSITLPGLTLLLKEDIPQGHKFALKAHTKGDRGERKYGNPIGTATQNIPAGAWVHTHNMKTGLGELLDYTYTPQAAASSATPPRYFHGYRRGDGTVGVRNEIWIIPTVGCVDDTATAIEPRRTALSAPGH